jgi:hypothetical protein
MSNRTIFNELGENRVINPRSGFSQFVDLSNNQTISGIKRFLNDLITNSNVNFNTTANIGRIVFNPNTIIDEIITIYSTDENSSLKWVFDGVGDLYYIGTGIAPLKIKFSATGDIFCIGILTSTSISSNAINCTSLNAGSGTISTTGNISCLNITSTDTINGLYIDLNEAGLILSNKLIRLIDE